MTAPTPEELKAAEERVMDAYMKAHPPPSEHWAICEELRCRHTCPVEDATEDKDGFLTCPQCGCGMEA